MDLPESLSDVSISREFSTPSPPEPQALNGPLLIPDPQISQIRGPQGSVSSKPFPSSSKNCCGVVCGFVDILIGLGMSEAVEIEGQTKQQRLTNLNREAATTFFPFRNPQRAYCASSVLRRVVPPQICLFVFNNFHDAPPATRFFSRFCMVARGGGIPLDLCLGPTATRRRRGTL